MTANLDVELQEIETALGQAAEAARRAAKKLPKKRAPDDEELRAFFLEIADLRRQARFLAPGWEE